MTEFHTPVYTVTQITEEVSRLFRDSFDSVCVEGEISGWKLAASGHAYFSLRDDKSLLKAVMWRSRLQRLSFSPADGQLVRVHGKLTVYAPRGDYQLDATGITQAGEGLLMKRFEELKARLAEEGLFDNDRKQPPPFHVRRVAVITSPTGAAIQDFLRVIRSSGVPVEILILPVRVQGVEAPAEIAEAIRRAPGLQPDLIVLTRGGGSLEDLWAFNEEIVARSIVVCPVPVVSAVGHEVDFTISDFVADVRVPTPTAAGRLVAELVETRFESVHEKQKGLAQAMSQLLSEARGEVGLCDQRLRSASPLLKIPFYRQQMDDRLDRCGRALKHRVEWKRQDLREYRSRIREAIRNRLALARSEVRVRQEKLLTLDPRSTLERGYARLETARSQRPIRSKKEVPVEENIRIHLVDGSLEATPHV